MKNRYEFVRDFFYAKSDQILKVRLNIRFDAHHLNEYSGVTWKKDQIHPPDEYK